MNNPRRINVDHVIKLSVGVTLVVSFGYLFYDSQVTQDVFLWALGKTTLLATALYFVVWKGLDKFLWKWLPRWIYPWPDLNGVWRGEGEVDTDTRPGVTPPISLDVRITITQTYSTFQVDYWAQRTDKSAPETESTARGDIEATHPEGPPFVVRYAFVTLPGMAPGEDPGLAVLSVKGGYTATALEGRWIAHGRAGISSGNVKVKRTKE